MTAPHGRGLLHLAAAVDQRGSFDAAAYVGPAQLAERGALDFVTLGDTSGRPGPDALGVLARVASATRRIGLVPTVPDIRPGSREVREAVENLDRISRGRAGWRSGGATAGAGTEGTLETAGAEGGTEGGDEARRVTDGEDGPRPLPQLGSGVGERAATRAARIPHRRTGEINTLFPYAS
ncbi:LLM class flavin-dependent oxidoreductase [Streptomyces sp. me109]|uniref:LLM class flavin-dependent oxidoreductase n=1 Tax=Streptomyces sp. me109 TaxID=1827853 RepID=UPI0011CDC790|nr:LLM class flavin-dependent oxidoreductase [Streptomyces sp. me109]TXS79897.1 LLM class flavin-dependent oxidoreductase [Streptomyces sp. me109]